MQCCFLVLLTTLQGGTHLSGRNMPVRQEHTCQVGTYLSGRHIPVVVSRLPSGTVQHSDVDTTHVTDRMADDMVDTGQSGSDVDHETDGDSPVEVCAIHTHMHLMALRPGLPG